MTPLMPRLQRVGREISDFAGSLAGRMALILMVGLSTAAISALLIAEHARRQDFERYRDQRLALSVAEVVQRLGSAPEETRRLISQDRIIGVRPAPEAWPEPRVRDERLSATLAAGLARPIAPEAQRMSDGYCRPTGQEKLQALAGMRQLPHGDCWNVSLMRPDGRRENFAFYLPPLILPPSATLNPLFLSLILAASALLSVFVARRATQPLKRLTQAARAFSRSIDAVAISEEGPRDVRTTMAAFNLMQRQVRDGVRERTQMLSSIAHDLQTPLTRLRLRLEDVSDPELRERLIGDLNATLSMVRTGLDLARSSESQEPWSVVDLDSLLSSLAEDFAEVHSKVVFVGGCGAQARVRPNALSRCLGNLIDNAVRYGGQAAIQCSQKDGQLRIDVVDAGPGIPEAAIASMFEPFQRGEAARRQNKDGTGIGLTIARALAATFGANIQLSNLAKGGLRARIVLCPNLRRGVDPA
ncbi:MAG: ATP-binding protein [Caulobacter sp.]